MAVHVNEVGVPGAWNITNSIATVYAITSSRVGSLGIEDSGCNRHKPAQRHKY